MNNDLFYQFINTHTCNFADDTTLSAFGTNLEDLLYNLEYDTQSAIVWFENNYMKLNQDKCHFLISGNVTEHLWAKVGDELIWESAEETLLGVTIDKHLNFNSHLNNKAIIVAVDKLSSREIYRIIMLKISRVPTSQKYFDQFVVR